MFVLAIAAIFMATIHQASGHFKLVYPQWRGDSMDEENFTSPSQWKQPCAGINHGPRTDWPLHNGAIQLKMSHAWDLVYINVDTSGYENFEYILFPNPVNVSGRGYFCFQNVNMPAHMEMTDGQNASIQVVGSFNDGNDMYNCADITFRANATGPSMCKNDTGMSATYEYWGPATGTSNASNATATVTVISPPTSTHNSATATTMGGMAFAAMAGLACVLAMSLAV
ncbi:hypothetical protein GGS26DRAFT_592926 [Hypomontagnella submonticulosa]|nr:hypothetical protein GGS26DRAFT_592926 [Hypomontagnella submonticulosa]